MPTVELCFNKKTIRNYSIGAGDTLLIGRNRVNDIVIDNLSVSAQHAKIESIGREFLFVDLQSENGSFVNDQHIKSRWLNHGDILTIGKHTLKFSNPGGNNEEKIRMSNDIKTMQIDTEKYRKLIEKNMNVEVQAADLLTQIDKAQKQQVGILSYLTGKKASLQLNAQIIRIGKDHHSDIVANGFGIGKTAAVINWLSDGWYIKYVGGFSKPRVNGKTLKSSAKLKNLDIIKVGKVKLQFLVSLSNDVEVDLIHN